MVEDPKELKDLVASFFKNLYNKDHVVGPTELLELVQVHVGNDMNDTLCREFNDQEISDDLFQMGPLKAPRPDGFPAWFLLEALGCPNRGCGVCGKEILFRWSDAIGY